MTGTIAQAHWRACSECVHDDDCDQDTFTVEGDAVVCEKHLTAEDARAYLAELSAECRRDEA